MWESAYIYKGDSLVKIRFDACKIKCGGSVFVLI